MIGVSPPLLISVFILYPSVKPVFKERIITISSNVYWIIHTCFIFQNAFAQLQRNETLAIMADTGARFSISIHMGLEIVECPPAKYFKDAAAEVRKHSTDSSLSIEEAMLLLKSLEKEAINKTDVSTAEALTRKLLTFLRGVCMKFQCQVLNIAKQMGSFPVWYLRISWFKSWSRDWLSEKTTRQWSIFKINI
jgi:hypothetical protein